MSLNPFFRVQEAGNQLINGTNGHDYMLWQGAARVTDTTGTSLSVLSVIDGTSALVIPASSTDPAYLHYLGFRIPTALTVGTTDVIKLATGPTIDATANTTASAVSAAASGGVLAAGFGRSIIPDGAPVALTADTTLVLCSSTAAGGAGVAGGNIRLGGAWTDPLSGQSYPAARGTFILVTAIWSKRQAVPTWGEPRLHPTMWNQLLGIS